MKTLNRSLIILLTLFTPYLVLRAYKELKMLIQLIIKNNIWYLVSTPDIIVIFIGIISIAIIIMKLNYEPNSNNHHTHSNL